MKKRKEIRALLLMLVLAVGIGFALGGCKKSGAQQETPVAKLGEDTIYLDEAVFYTRMLQEQWEYSYYEYAGSGMWQEEFDEDGRTFAEVLKQDVMDTLTRIHLLCAHAGEYQTELTKEEQAAVAKRAAAFMESNTPSVLEAAGATEALVEELLLKNELAAKVSEAIQAGYTPELDEEAAKVGKLTYCLFSTMGTYDAQGNHTAATEDELNQIRLDAEAFAERAKELSDIAAAGEEFSHTVIDVYYNEETDGGAHPAVAQAARALELGGISDILETEDGYYIVQRVSDYDEEASAEYLDSMILQAKEDYQTELEEAWKEETPLVIDEEVWDTVVVDEMLTEP